MMVNRVTLEGVHDPLAVEDRLRRNRDRAEMIGWLRGQAADRTGECAWYVVSHAGRDGESLVADMQAEGIEAWCPMRKIVKKHGRQRATVKRSVPLFEGYVMVRLLRGWDAAFVGVLTFDRVTGLLGDCERPTPLASHLVKRIRDFEASPMAVQQRLFAPGDRVAVHKGSFEGFDAIVVRQENRKGEVAVDVDIFGRMTRCRLYVDSLRLLD